MNILTYIATGILGGDPSGVPKTPIPTAQNFTHILEYVFGVIAAISFLMIVFAGFRYVISIGDPAKIATARKTITYSIIGLIVSLSATAIVAFVIGNV